jgi:transcriptional regulator with XRE-family HTH domain
MKPHGGWVKEGLEMRRLREMQGLSRSQVEPETLRVVSRTGIRGFHVSQAYLRDIEDGHCVPGALKLVSLAEVYGQRPERLVRFYEVVRAEDKNRFTSFPSSAGSVSNPAVDEGEQRRVLGKVARKYRSKIVRVLEKYEDVEVIPTSWREKLGGKQIRFAVLGTDDHKMGKILPPDSLLAVDTQQKTIDESEEWPTDAERPVYLSSTEDGHVCCWAYRVGSVLTLLPYQANSLRPAKWYKTPTEAEISGRVICAWRLPPDDALEGAETRELKAGGQMNADD